MKQLLSSSPYMKVGHCVRANGISHGLDSGKLLLIFICNFHVLRHLLLIYICKLHWNFTWARLSVHWLMEVHIFLFRYEICIFIFLFILHVICIFSFTRILSLSTRGRSIHTSVNSCISYRANVGVRIQVSWLGTK